MVRDISSFEIRAFAVENENLINGYIKNFVEINSNRYRLEINKNGRIPIIISFSPKLISVTKIIENGTNPTSEVIHLKKEINGKKIKGIKQEDLERRVIFEIEDANLIIDFTPNFNIILEKNGNIFKLFKKPEKDLQKNKNDEGKKQAKQTAKTNENKKDLKEGPENERGKFFELFNAGVAPLYANEFISRKLSCSVENWLDELIEKKEYWIYFEDKKLKDYAITSISKYTGLEARKLDSINELLDHVYEEILNEEKNRKEDVEKQKITEKIKKLEEVLKTQEETIKKLKEEEKKNREVGEYIFQHLDEINEILSKAKKGEYPIEFKENRKIIRIKKD